ncbi:MAG TPA: PQQ-binding-like beta-propeller repeat protein [Steroidobacteraceae bacterium]|jgi:hypothetical protein|nr:PQQ-binding-like beta-propeller repeat protein [Steroidobacteraceae bacterium]
MTADTANATMLAACLALAACGGHSSAVSSAGSAGGSGTGTTVFGTDVLTYHNDAMRTGQNLTESLLTPQNVNAASFGKLRILPADGLVDAAPLIVSGISLGGATRNVVYMASEHDSVYAYDADSGALLLQTSLLGSGESSSDPRGCGQVTPEIGITATPVIDRSAGPNGTLFVVAMSRDAGGNYSQRLHALDLQTLADRLPAVTIQASAPGNGPTSAGGTLQFDPKQYKERSALLLVNGRIYLAFASHCDIQPYNGWMMSYDESTLAQSAVLQLTPNGSEGAIWDVGGLAADQAGDLFATVANGTFDTTLDAQGMPNEQDYGNAALRITASGTALAISDYFTPFNTASESANDVDLGSGSVVLLMDQTDDAGTTHHLMTVGGKDENLYVLNRDNLGHFSSTGNAVYQQIPVGGGLYSAPVYFNGSVYVGAAGGTLQAFGFANAQLPATPSSQTATTFAYPGTSPAISAMGSANAILWALESNTGSAAVLHAFNPANLGEEYYNSTQAGGSRDSFGNGNKFITPVIANGKVFIGTPSGVAVFGLR